MRWLKVIIEVTWNMPQTLGRGRKLLISPFLFFPLELLNQLPILRLPHPHNLPGILIVLLGQLPQRGHILDLNPIALTQGPYLITLPSDIPLTTPEQKVH